MSTVQVRKCTNVQKSNDTNRALCKLNEWCSNMHRYLSNNNIRNDGIYCCQCSVDVLTSYAGLNISNSIDQVKMYFIIYN